MTLAPRLSPRLLSLAVLVGPFVCLQTIPTFAQELAPAVAPAATQGVTSETAFILNTLLLLGAGLLVMFMAAGFAMLEAGLVRTKNVAAQCLKNLGLYAVAGLMFWLVGYNLMFNGVDGGYFGALELFFRPDDRAAFDAEGAFLGGAAGHASAAAWFFQMVFCATAGSIVSGAVAERTKVWSFLIFAAFLSALIYPIVGAWTWGGGWLAQIGFKDFAGSTVVHATGGWAALVGAILVGARDGKFGPGGTINPMPGSALPLAALGTFILWLGWFGFNGGSLLATGSAEAAVKLAAILVNTNNAAAGGALAAMVLTQLVYRKIDLTMALNGALAGLVAITAEPLTPSLGEAAFIGAVGGVLVVVFVPLIDRLRIDDVVGAVSVHLVAGIWGTLAVPVTNPEAQFAVQAVGVLAVGAFVATASLLFWLAIKVTIGLRTRLEAEHDGLDQSELGLDAYPEFGRNSSA